MKKRLFGLGVFALLVLAICGFILRNRHGDEGGAGLVVEPSPIEEFESEPLPEVLENKTASRFYAPGGFVPVERQNIIFGGVVVDMIELEQCVNFYLKLDDGVDGESFYDLCMWRTDLVESPLFFPFFPGNGNASVAFHFVLDKAYLSNWSIGFHGKVDEAGRVDLSCKKEYSFKQIYTDALERTGGGIKESSPPPQGAK